MRMYRFAVVAVVAALSFAAACGGGGDSASCKTPPTVKLDGTEIAGLTNGLAFKENGGYTLHVFNKSERTCEDVKKGMWSATEGEQYITVMAGGSMGGVSYDASTKMGKGVGTSLATKPAKEGDPIAICASAKYKLMVGDKKDKELIVDGKFEGKFCGER